MACAAGPGSRDSSGTSGSGMASAEGSGSRDSSGTSGSGLASAWGPGSATGSDAGAGGQGEVDWCDGSDAEYAALGGPFEQIDVIGCARLGRQRVVVLEGVSSAYREVLATYASGPDLVIDPIAPGSLPLDEGAACLVVQQPNFFGYLEDLRRCAEAAHAVGALLVVSADPISLGLLRPPGHYGADIVVGEGQALGNAISFGGPYVGLFACRQEHLRQMPGRIAGRTLDGEGNPGFVLTLQTREQHIRRERATSNICTSEQLVGLACTIYLAALGRTGLRQVAELCYQKAHYAAARIAALPGWRLPMEGIFFQEFVAVGPRPPAEVNAALLRQGIIGGLDIDGRIPNGMLLCFSELHSRHDIDRLVAALDSVGGE